MLSRYSERVKGRQSRRVSTAIPRSFNVLFAALMLASTACGGGQLSSGDAVAPTLGDASTVNSPGGADLYRSPVDATIVSRPFDANRPQTTDLAGCKPDCNGRVCGPDPTCGVSCGICSNGSCNVLGQCVVARSPGCSPGTTRCSDDSTGFQVCKAPQSYGKTVSCLPGSSCSSQTGLCHSNSCTTGDLFFLLDRSASIALKQADSWIYGALTELLPRWQSVHRMGMALFPSGAGTCGPGLPKHLGYDQADALILSMYGASVDGETPLVGGLQGALSVLTGDLRDGRHVILITDGGESCQSPELALSLAKQLWSRGIRVHVLALADSPHLTFLHKLASAGGTGQARLVKDKATLSAALNSVVDTAGLCTCKPGQTLCGADDQVLRCDESGQTFTFHKTCAENAICLKGQCQFSSIICGEGGFRCDGKRYETCVQGHEWKLVQDCGAGFCTMFGCRSSCKPGSAFCIDNTPHICNSSGTGIQPTQSCGLQLCSSYDKGCVPRQSCYPLDGYCPLGFNSVGNVDAHEVGKTVTEVIELYNETSLPKTVIGAEIVGGGGTFTLDAVSPAVLAAKSSVAGSDSLALTVRFTPNTDQYTIHAELKVYIEGVASAITLKLSGQVY